MGFNTLGALGAVHSLNKIAKNTKRQADDALARAWEEGRIVGWGDGWRAGQADLIKALKEGRVRLQDL